MAAPTNAANVKKAPCQLGAVHTWHFALHSRPSNFWQLSDQQPTSQDFVRRGSVAIDPGPDILDPITFGLQPSINRH